MACVLAERSFIWTISVFMKFAGRVKIRMLNDDDNDNDNDDNDDNDDDDD